MRSWFALCGVIAATTLLGAQGTGPVEASSIRVMNQGRYHPHSFAVSSPSVTGARLFGVSDEPALARMAPLPSPGPASTPAATGNEMDFSRLTALAPPAGSDNGTFQRMVGPAHIVTIAGSWIHVERRGNSHSVSFESRSLWSAVLDDNAAPTARLRDLHFDAAFGCWTIMASPADSDPSQVLLAVSASVDPEGDWDVYVLDGALTNQSPTALLRDGVLVSSRSKLRIDESSKQADAPRSAMAYGLAANAVPDVPYLSLSSHATSGVRNQFFFQASTSTAPLRQVWFMINSSLTAANACYVFYDVAAGKFGLVNDTGTGEAGRLLPNQTGTVQNSQCVLESGTISVATTYVYASITLSFKPAFGGSKAQYLYADTTSGVSTGWQVKGSYLVPSGNLSPQVVTTSTIAGLGKSGQFNMVVTDADGSADVRQIWFLMSDGLASRNSCWVFYSSGQFGLVNDAGTAEVGRVTSVSQSLANSQCTLSTASSSTYNNQVILYGSSEKIVGGFGLRQFAK